jgi:transposase-like protein
LTVASALSAPHFHDEDAAFAYVEARVWPEGPTCPHCGGTERISKMQGASTRKGLYKCYQCRKPFTVRVGTIFESSHVPMHIWLQAMYLIAGSKKGISSNQLHRTLGVTLKTAWFMSHRIREAMKQDGPLMGADGGMVEVDETFYCRRTGVDRPRAGFKHLRRIMTLVERNTGRATSIVTEFGNQSEVAAILEAHLSTSGHLMTDEYKTYKNLGWNFAAHSTVNHGEDEYVSRANPAIHTNTIEGFFSIFKRGMRGVYQFCKEQHLHRYVAEFDFRYSNRQALGCNDADRADRLLAGIVGKRLTYQTTLAARA